MYSISGFTFTEGQEVEVEVASVVGEDLDVVCEVSDTVKIICVA